MKLIIETGSEWIYATIVLCIVIIFSKTIQWILSKLFPFKDCNQYTKDRIGARAAFLNICKTNDDMSPTIYNNY